MSGSREQVQEQVQQAQPAVADPAALSPLKRAFLALEQAQARAAALEQAAREPIAIIGMGCRVPGGGNDPQSFWRLMHDGVDAIGRVPAERWDIEAYYDANPEVPGKIATREGGFLEAVDRFDPTFFGIAPREADGMDPQQRLLLEVIWEALEHAGQAPDRLEHSPTGVYVGATSSDYTYLQLKSQDAALLDAHFTSGIAHSIFSGRISYLLGLQGPSLTVDTACSSSLVAVHLACQALRAGECRMALAGGVNLILAPDVFIALSHSRMLAPDGRCKTFDAAADGFARGEGCGVIVLKKLSDARADGDRVLAVIRGSAVNQDGPSSGLTAPNGPAQEAVIRAALARAGVAAREVGFIEAHGTGTQLGDPLEVHALGAVFGPDRGSAAPLWIGSAKTNVGHLEGAAGIAGLIKVVLALQHRTIPAHLHFRTPSPHIDWAQFPLRVPTAAVPWEAIDGRRIAGVSSFGFSGTNAHVVLEEAPAHLAAAAAAEGPVTIAAAGRAQLFTLSAKDAAARAQLAARYVQALAHYSDTDLADLCHTTNLGRARLGERATVMAHSVGELAAGLAALAQGRSAVGLRTATVALSDPPRIAFLFTGQGAQYPGMARALYEAAPAFRSALDECARLLVPYLERPLLEVMFADANAGSALHETAYTQPALFALEYALTQLWRSWGILPNMVMGHSVGELVAACVAGVFELEDALRLIARRGQLMQSLPAGGAMAAIGASEASVSQVIAPHAAQVSIAAVNGPAQTVISGAAEVVAAVCAQLTAAGVRCTALTVSHAFHSPLVEPILERFEREVAATKLSAPGLRLISNLTGAVAQAEEIVSPGYWRRHVREAVRFGAGLESLRELRPDVIVEIGPHPTLLAFAGAVFGEGGPQRIASLRKGAADWEQMLDAAALLYLSGASLDWRAVGAATAHQAPRLIDLPTYPFQRERHWFTARPATAARAPTRAGAHALLGTRLRSACDTIIHESRVGADTPSFVRQHRVLGRVVLPATGYLDMLLACARAVLRTDVVSVEDVVVKEALLLADDGAVRVVQTICEDARAGTTRLAINSSADQAQDDAPWTCHVTAMVRAGGGDADGALQPGAASLEAARAACTRSVDPKDFYADFESRGLDFGAGFRAIRQLWCGESQAVGSVELSAELAAQGAGYVFHPVLLDGCLQVLAATLPRDSEVLYLPIAIARYVLRRRPTGGCWSHVVLREGTGEIRRADLRIFDERGALLAELHDVQLKRVSRDALERLGERWLDECLYETRWKAVPLVAADGGHAWSPEELTREVAPQVPALAESVGLVSHETFLERLETLCGDYAVRTLQQLGWSAAVGARVSQSVLAQQLRVSPAHRRLFVRLLAILAEQGLLARDPAAPEMWQLLKSLPRVDPVNSAQQLLRAYPQGAVPELELTARVAAEFAEALRGEREPMQLLFPGGSLETAERMYRDSPTAKLYSGMMARILNAAAVKARAAGRPLRVLEVGAGTGGTTAHVLPALVGQAVEYTFTDVGPLFVARAKDRFGTFEGTRFEVLDLERDPVEQGFGDRRFDVVIAANVIHATADVRRALSRVRGLLVPGGLLAMLEVTAPQRWFDFTVGLTEGWWAFTDADLRADYVTLSRERWLAVLADCGFDERSALPAADMAQGSLALQSLLVARARADTDTGAGIPTWLLFADRQGTGSELATRLRAGGAKCVVVHAGEFSHNGDTAAVAPALSSDYRKLLASVRAAGGAVRGVVHAWSLDTPPSGSGGAGDLTQSQQRGVLSVLHVAQALVAECPTSRLWVLTRGAQPVTGLERALAPDQAALWGLGKSLALEHPELSCVCVDLDATPEPSELDALMAELGESGVERQVAIRAGARWVARLARLRPPAKSVDEVWRLAPEVSGSLDRFQRVPLARRAPGAGEVEIAVEATALNFKDVLNALGMYPGNPGPLGGECAGRVVAVGAGVTHVQLGDEVMAVAGGSFGSHVIARAELVQPRPASVSVAEAASFPIAYLTAEFCLGHLARMQRGDRVLIHAAAGGVGMAAVRLALRAGAEVFATAGSEWKRGLLRSMGVRHVFDSRSASFAAEIMACTAGRGVDVVLNSLAGELIDASFSVLARGGRFVEIGKRGIKDAAWVAALNRDLRYHIVDWGETAAREPALIGALFARLTDELRAGTLAPLPLRVFSEEHAARAFRFMAQARHAGKIVVSQAGSPMRVRRDATYLVTGGLSGLGLLTARWLAERGAARLVLIGRRGVTPEATVVLDGLRASGTQVLTAAMDVSSEADLRGLLERVRASGPPLRGVVHSAGVLDDASLLQQDAQRFAHVFAPKVRGGGLLDSLTAQDSLDWFVAFSSVAAVFGSPGQANHCAANAFLDVLAHERRLRGLPSLSINWGPWTEVGAAADRGLIERLASQGVGALTPDQGLVAFGRLLESAITQAAVLPVDWERYLRRFANGAVPTFWTDLAGAEVSGAPRKVDSQADAARGVGLREQLAGVPESRRRPLLAAFVRERALRALGIDLGRQIDPRTPLGDLGLDSLLAVELRNTLGTALGTTLPATLLFDYPSIETLTDYLLEEVLGFAGSQPASAPQSAPAGLVGSIEAMSDDEVDRLIAARTKRKA